MRTRVTTVLLALAGLLVAIAVGFTANAIGSRSFTPGADALPSAGSLAPATPPRAADHGREACQEAEAVHGTTAHHDARPGDHDRRHERRRQGLGRRRRLVGQGQGRLRLGLERLERLRRPRRQGQRRLAPTLTKPWAAANQRLTGRLGGWDHQPKRGSQRDQQHHQDDRSNLYCRRRACRCGGSDGLCEAGRDGVRVAGICDNGSTSKLKVKRDDGRLKFEFEVDQNVTGVVWDVDCHEERQDRPPGPAHHQGAERLLQRRAPHQGRYRRARSSPPPRATGRDLHGDDHGSGQVAVVRDPSPRRSRSDRHHGPRRQRRQRQRSRRSRRQRGQPRQSGQWPRHDGDDDDQRSPRERRLKLPGLSPQERSFAPREPGPEPGSRRFRRPPANEPVAAVVRTAATDSPGCRSGGRSRAFPRSRKDHHDERPCPHAGRDRRGRRAAGDCRARRSDARRRPCAGPCSAAARCSPVRRCWARCPGPARSARPTRARASAGDVDILNFALTLEFLEAAFYAEAV